MKKVTISILMGLIMLGSAFAGSPRKVLVVSKTEYPRLAREMRVSGAVKLEAVVLPTGKIKELKVLGGHPLLAESAQKSAMKWQFEPASTETVETITVNFNLDQ
ncbi:MAG: energy transducer TonB [Acidobacteriales bacterium]|nr:energy transducer TonB [Terriglobales bacterium]